MYYIFEKQLKNYEKIIDYSKLHLKVIKKIYRQLRIKKLFQ